MAQWQRFLAGVTTNSLHPGAVVTEIDRDAIQLVHLIKSTLRYLGFFKVDIFLLDV